MRAQLPSLTLLLLLAGCPQPATEGTTGPGGPQMGAPGDPNGVPGAAGLPGDPNAAVGDPNAAAPDPANAIPVDPNAPPPDPNAPPQPGMAGDAPTADPPPGFASLITGGKTVTISGTVTGAKAATIEFMFVNANNVPQLLEQLKSTDGTFKVTAPATYAGAIYVTASVDKKDDGPTPDDLAGAAAGPIKLEGKDLTVAITVSDSPDWMSALPWHVAPKDGDPPPTGAPGTTPVGAPPVGAPTSPAPAGAAPTDPAAAPK